ERLIRNRHVHVKIHRDHRADENRNDLKLSALRKHQPSDFDDDDQAPNPTEHGQNPNQQIHVRQSNAAESEQHISHAGDEIKQRSLKKFPSLVGLRNSTMSDNEMNVAKMSIVIVPNVW